MTEPISQRLPASVVLPMGPAKVELSITGRGVRGPVGPQGPQGIPGPNAIGGFPIQLADPRENDVLQLIGGAWRNVPQTNIVDGGNF